MSEAPQHFARPELAHALWGLLAFLVLLVWLELRGAGALEGLVGRALQSRLVERPARWRRWLRIGLIGFAGLCMIIALMRPQYGLRYVSTPRVGAEIMIALDVSNSMLADDAPPSRLERAKAEIIDLLDYLGDDHVGLIAFAGRASVLSPMTPDKSFLRLVLEGAGPHSVTRGGTSLEEPIRRAISGFGPPGPAQRALILITDGEDHDSFALDAAKAAAEAGVKIIAIGFGDEAGSEIQITDPRSGARTRLRDADGRPVVSRLDGDLLRELALATDGAYVPAGTGVLDLASIYDLHIARLTRGQLDERGHTIRDEIYQWFVLLALLSIVAAAAIAASRGAPASETRAAGGSAVLPLLLIAALMTAPLAARAQEPVGSDDALGEASASQAGEAAPVDPAAPFAEADAAVPGSSGTDADATEGGELDPRTLYNRAGAALAQADLEAAAAGLRRARREAGDDLELRFRSTYNLGIASIARAEALEPSAPEDALAALREAADWFRDAAGQRPEDQATRHNLEVALRRALVLADFLAQQEQRDLPGELDALIEDQRARVLESAELLEQVVRSGELDATDSLRAAFRSAATAQRTLLSDADDLAERSALERDAIAQMTEEERTPQDEMRGAQLDAVLHYLDRARERMGQTRRQLRQRRAERSYRRASAALGELKRARDQLRSPVERLDVLIGEIDRVAVSTAALARKDRLLGEADGSGGPGAAAAGTAAAKRPVLPAFLTLESLSEEHASVVDRVHELGEGFEAGLERAAAQQDESQSGATADGEAMPPEAEALLAAVREAAPHVGEAESALAEATSALADAALEVAHAQQRRAQVALAEARERFFDLRQLVEASHADEQRIAAVAGATEPAIAEARDEYAAALRALQEKNLERGERLEAKIAEAVRAIEQNAAALQAQPPGGPVPGSGAPSPEQLEAERERMQVASALATQALAAMDDARAALGASGEPQSGRDGDVDWTRTAQAAERATGHLENLRLLFFSIVEHVRELARKQVDLNDRTQDAVALSAPATAASDPAADAAGSGSTDSTGSAASPGSEAGAAPSPADVDPHASPRSPDSIARTTRLAQGQVELAERAGQIGDALASQASEAAEAGPASASPPPADAQQGEGEETAKRLRLAAEHVVSAQLAMRAAGSVLSDESAPLAPARAHQDTALVELEQALALLQPPRPPEPQEQQQEQQQDRSQQEQDAQAEPRENTQGSADPAQLLQGVRDREAERRRERERKRASARTEPVDKDW